MNILLINKICEKQLRKDLPILKSGYTVKLYIKVSESNKFRIQIFEGVIIKLQGIGISKTITVRKISNGISVEKIIPLNSPILEKIEILKIGKVRRAKIYYIRKRIGKIARIKEKLIKQKK